MVDVDYHDKDLNHNHNHHNLLIAESDCKSEPASVNTHTASTSADLVYGSVSVVVFGILID